MYEYLEYLTEMRDHRHHPYHFVVVYEDYRWVEIPDVHEFDLNTLRKNIIGVAIWMPGEGYNGIGMWATVFSNPFGGAIEKRIWRMRDAVNYICSKHLTLKVASDHQHAHPIQRKVFFRSLEQMLLNLLPKCP